MRFFKKLFEFSSTVMFTLFANYTCSFMLYFTGFSFLKKKRAKSFSFKPTALYKM